MEEGIFAISPVMTCPMCDSPCIEKQAHEVDGYADCECWECHTTWVERDWEELDDWDED